TDGKGEIEWKIEDVLEAETILREFLSAGSGGGDDDAVVGIVVTERADEPSDGEHLSDGDGMHPDHGPVVAAQVGGHPAEALTEAGAILATADHLPQPPGQ